jgi:glycosyltransferase involved in cell wall biosynthesis
MRRVLFDSQAFVMQSRGGISRYHHELAVALARRERWRPLVHAGVHFAELPPASVLPRVGLSVHLRREARGTRLVGAVNRLLVPARRIRRWPPRCVYHATLYDRRAIDRLADLPLVLTLHDLIQERWPEVTTPQQLADRAAAIARADGIVCVSQATRDALVERFPEAAEKSAVALLGLPSYAVAEDPPVAPPPATSRPYVVYVGKRGSYKNFDVIVRALPLTDPDLRVVAVGGGPLSERLLAELADLGVSGRLEHVADVTDDELRALLQGASALVSPSLEEGFGLPPLEALANGCPVVLADIPVYREVYGPWATFFEPTDPEALAAALDAVARGEGARPDRATLLEHFDWDRTAAATEVVYERALERRTGSPPAA